VFADFANMVKSKKLNLIVGEYDINKNQHHDIDIKFSEVPLIYYYKNGMIEKP